MVKAKAEEAARIKAVAESADKNKAVLEEAGKIAVEEANAQATRVKAAADLAATIAAAVIAADEFRAQALASDVRAKAAEGAIERAGNEVAKDAAVVNMGFVELAAVVAEAGIAAAEVMAQALAPEPELGMATTQDLESIELWNVEQHSKLLEELDAYNKETACLGMQKKKRQEEYQAKAEHFSTLVREHTTMLEALERGQPQGRMTRTLSNAATNKGKQTGSARVIIEEEGLPETRLQDAFKQKERLESESKLAVEQSKEANIEYQGFLRGRDGWRLERQKLLDLMKEEQARVTNSTRPF